MRGNSEAAHHPRCRDRFRQDKPAKPRRRPSPFRTQGLRAAADVGASRKRLLGGLTGDGSEGTLAGTVAVNLTAVSAGAAIVRVHDVAEHVAALRVLQAFRAPR